jgi:RNA polymerase sigma factor (TIGR02999 family)
MSLTPSPAVLSLRHEMSEAASKLTVDENGDPHAGDQLLELVYDELRHVASFKMAQQAPGQTLQATALVHEAWLRLASSENRIFKDRRHFFNSAAEAMRHILIDRTRKKRAQRHGGQYVRVDFDEFDLAAPSPDDQLLAVDEMVDRFALKFPIQAEVVKLRYFAGMTNEEVSQLLEISLSSIQNYWNFARAWFFKEIEGK